MCRFFNRICENKLEKNVIAEHSEICENYSVFFIIFHSCPYSQPEQPQAEGNDAFDFLSFYQSLRGWTEHPDGAPKAEGAPTNNQVWPEVDTSDLAWQQEYAGVVPM